MENRHFKSACVLQMLLLLFTFLSYSAFPTQLTPEDDSSCFDSQSAKTYILDLNINVESFGGNELCQNNSELKKLLSDLYILQMGQFSEGAPHALNPGFIKSSQYYPWLKSQTKEIEREKNTDRTPAFNSQGRIVLQHSWPLQSTMDRIGTLIHEARHTTGYPHERCAQGPYVEMYGFNCDRSFSHGGAHAVEIEYYARVALYGRNFHPMYQSMARLMAMARGNFVFNKPALTQREGLLIQTDSGHFWLSDNQRWLFRPPLRVGNRMVNGLLKRTSFGASLFSGNRAFAIDLYKNKESEPLTDLFSYFKIINDMNITAREFEEFDINNKRIVLSISNDNRFSTFNFSQSDWRPYLPLDFTPLHSSTVSPTYDTGYFVIDTDYNVHAFDSNTYRFIKTNKHWDSEILGLAKVNGDLLALTKHKKLLKFVDQRWIELPLPPGVKINQMATVPLFQEMDLIE